MNYVHSFMMPIPKKHMKTYLKIAESSAKAWKKHGALKYIEAVGEGLKKGKVTSFPRSVKLKSGEVVVAAHVFFKSKAHMNQVTGKMMKDKKVMEMWHNIPADGMRMIFGEFKTIAAK